MKTKIDFTQTCWALSAFVICLSTARQSQGQTLPEQQTDSNNGFKPVVSCDRRSDATARIQFVWTDSTSTYRRINTNLGDPNYWSTKATFFSVYEGRIDPFATSDIWSTDATVPRVMYFGWWTQICTDQNHCSTGASFRRSLSGTDVDNDNNGIPITIPVIDRPWLVATKVSLYLSFRSASPFQGYVERAPIPTGTPPPPPVVWPSGDPVVVFSPASNTALVSNFPVTAHSDFAGNEKAFLLARQYVSSGCTGANNMIRIKRSTDNGVDWGNEQTINVDGVDGFIYNRDNAMLTDHVTCNPNTSSKQIYAFYVRNEVSPYLNGPLKRNVLYCKASLDGGSTWNGERKVFSLDQSGLPQNFASVPNCSGNTDAGFYRIGRVWSCVDSNGYVYVAWMDNRYGQYSTTKDYWQVFCSRSTDQGDTWSTVPTQVSGTSDVHTASIGGFAGFDSAPPGDFLTCDADSQYLYVAWPDSRNQQGGQDMTYKVYFRRVQFQ
jgi:hypothetical protein